MTREEARLTLQENLGYLTSVHHQRILDAIEVAIEVLSESSLPSNLDEAAKEYAKTTSIKVWGRVDPKKDLKCFLARANYETGLLDGFIAGAEWMAGQGYTVDGIVICDKELTKGYKDIVMSIPDELKVDDKVTIQIRKRQ